MMMTQFPAIQHALNTQPTSIDSIHRYFKLCLSYVEYVSPSEISQETGRLMKLLSQFPQGLAREELLSKFYPDYLTASFSRQSSFKTCLEKIIQRSRMGFQKYKLTVYYNKEDKKYYLNLL